MGKKKRLKQFVKDNWVFKVDLMLDDFEELKKRVAENRAIIWDLIGIVLGEEGLEKYESRKK